MKVLILFFVFLHSCTSSNVNIAESVVEKNCFEIRQSENCEVVEIEVNSASLVDEGRPVAVRIVDDHRICWDGDPCEKVFVQLTVTDSCGEVTTIARGKDCT